MAVPISLLEVGGRQAVPEAVLKGDARGEHPPLKGKST
eukprot:CAMPEP_0117689064 /NCGR_PEP_ID=MMETSP0804-20121206/24239_1 /TAXON_ID=1074897 /ORGANISM="Tetraselmis astigmatica, Strain CCMP880" /LENGTH=37 /DNA_ID= /DNA_START= /DNA_END= /DNA_ORIENTATION=